MLKIASIDGLECLLARSQMFEHLCLTLDGSQAESFLKTYHPSTSVQKLNSNNYLESLVNDEQIIRDTNLTDILKRNNVKYFFLAHRSTPYIENWAKKHDLTLVRTEWPLQRNFEDKIFFQKFMESYGIPSPKAYILNNVDDVENVKKFPCVIQIPSVNPAISSTLLNSRKDLDSYLSLEEVNFPLICREYVKGRPLGISILIGKKNLVFSSLRLQCFGEGPDPFSEFLGIQWVPYNSFSEAEINNLNNVVLSLARSLQNEGFTGVANIDLILNDNGVYVIECNPRMSSATPCLAIERSLIHDINFTDEFIAAICEGELNYHIPTIPKSNFAGTLIEFDYLVDKLNCSGVEKINNLPKSGFWNVKDLKLNYLGAMEEHFKLDSSFLFFSSLSKDFPLAKVKHLGLAFTNSPLFEFDSIKNVCHKSSFGEKFIQIIERQILP